MLESVTYQMIIEEGIERGEIQGHREMLLDLGTTKFGPPDGGVVAAVERLTTLDELRRLGRRLLTVQSWDELLASV